VLALSTAVGVALLVLGGILVVVAGGVLLARGRTRDTQLDIPTAMRPGPADAALETPLLHKLQGWAVLLVAFSAIWIPLNWLREPGENLTQERAQEAAKIERGHEETLYFSEENQLGFGCIRCHGPELHGGVVQSGVNADGSPRFIYPLNLTLACNHLTVDQIRSTIEEGRIAQGMPSWSIKFSGAMDDQQIDDLVQYIVSLNQKTVPFSQNKCTNPKLMTTASPSASASTSTASAGGQLGSAAATPSTSPTGGA
jgi:mono/diheme cytochrome c family protein